MWDLLVLTNRQKRALGPIKHHLATTRQFDIAKLLKTLSPAPSDLWYEETVDWYTAKLTEFDSFNILWDIKNRNRDKYMKLEHQKSYAKAYFVPLLEAVFDFCDKKWYTQMAQAMRFNIKDESWIRPVSKTNKVYDDSPYTYPVFTQEEKYKGEPHASRRAYEYNWLQREYWTVIRDERNVGMIVFNYLTWTLLNNSSEQYDFMKIGAVAAAEKIIPIEFIYMKEARDRLFPWLTQKEKHYMDDHILHDAEYHFKDILVWLEAMNLTSEQELWTKEWMHLYYVWRAYMYSSFKKQIEPKALAKILSLPPVFSKFKYAAAASAIICMSILWMKSLMQNKNDPTDLYKVTNIGKYEAIVAREAWVYDEYMSWTSTNFTMIDYVSYEALRRAIIAQKWVDIWSLY